MTAAVLLAIFFPLLCSPLFLLFKKAAPSHLGFIAIFYAFISLAGVLGAGVLSNWSEPHIVSIPWVPSLGVNLSFILDGLSLFFGILVTAMGILVSWYSQYYMDPQDPKLGRFYFFLMFFMGAMLGTVFSNNLMLLFCFWELTGVASFLLIGYKQPLVSAYKGARMALLVTALTSLALLAGIIMLDILAETFEWNQLVNRGVPFNEHVKWASPIIICFLIGIFGKSAQFPFYFWLPNAMVAPAPVSAYLHAATMVKLGIFLTARMYPLFVSHELWYLLLTSFSFATLLIGAALSLLSNDLKAILAYATVSQLGFFIGFYGIGGEEGIEYDFVHILNHAFYKGSLFMLVGIIEHATGIRDIRRLGGLWSKLPLTMVIFFIAAAAMAGIPGTTGFLSKELILTDIIALGRSHHSGWWILAILIFASLFKVAFSFRLFYHLFVRDLQDKSKKILDFHIPSLGIQIPPLILASVAFIFGVWPTGLEHLSQYFYVSGLHKLDPRELQIWHGWTIELMISMGILAGGTLVFLTAERYEWRWTRLSEKFSLSDAFEHFIDALPKMGGAIAYYFEPWRYERQLGTLFGLFGIGLGGFLFFYAPLDGLSAQFAQIYPVRFMILFLISTFTVLVAIFKRPIAKLISLSGCGFFIAIYFTVYEAPDLAMTQILVEVATFLIILLLFRQLGDQIEERESAPRRIWPLPIALACGLTAALIVALYHAHELDRGMKDFFIANSLSFAHGSNVVNTILIDFRGLDTLGEATVLITAMLGVIGLLMNRRDLAVDAPPLEIPMNSSILRSVLPLVFLLANLFAVYLLFRGHHEPGGGFIAGLVSGIALILVGITTPLFKNFFSFVKLGFGGLGVILLAGLIPLLFGRLFLTHYIDLSSWPALEYVSMYTPLIFDIGVYLVVLAMTVSIYFFFRQAKLIRY